MKNYNNILNFANFFLKLAAKMSKLEAADLLGVNADDDLGKIKTKYREMVMTHHPDRGGSEKMMKKINEAFETLTKAEDHTHPRSHHRKDVRVEEEPITPNKKDIRWCKQYIKEVSKQYGNVHEYTLWNFDGMFFRDVMTVETNEECFPLAALVFEELVDFFKTVAIFISISNNEILLLRLNGQDVHNENKIYTRDSFSANPGNDRSFVRKLREEFDRYR